MRQLWFEVKPSSHSCFFDAAESENFTMKLTCCRKGGCLRPDLDLTEAEQRPLGKYGRMRLRCSLHPQKDRHTFMFFTLRLRQTTHQ